MLNKGLNIDGDATRIENLFALRQIFGDARKAFVNLSDPALNSEHTLLTSVVGNGDYTIKLVVLFNYDTIDGPKGPQAIVVPTFMLHEWVKGRIVATTTTCKDPNLYLAYDTMQEKMQAYRASLSGQQALVRQTPIPTLVHFGGDDPAGYNDPTAPLPPKSQRALRRLHLIEHLDQLVQMHNGAFFEFDKSQAQSIPALFGLPRGTKAQGPGPDVTADAEGFQIVRRAKLPARGRNGQDPSPASFSYQYSITRVGQTDTVLAPSPLGTFVESYNDTDTVQTETVPLTLESYKDLPAGLQDAMVSLEQADMEKAASAEGARWVETDRNGRGNTSSDFAVVEGIRASAALVAAAIAAQGATPPNDAGTLLTHEQRSLRELDKIQNAVDRLRFMHEDPLMLTRARARIAELEAQVGTLQEKLAKSQAQLKALIDLG